MYWLLLTIAAISSRATYSLAAKILTNRLHMSAGTQNVMLTGLATLFGLALSPLLGGIHFENIGQYWLPIVAAILCASFGGIAYFIGQKHLDASTTQIAFSSILFWGVILSVGFLGSQFSALQALGIVLLFVAIILVQYRPGKRRIDAGILWIIASAALFAGMQVASAGLSKHITTATYLLFVYGGPTIVVGALYVRSLLVELPVLAREFRHTSVAVLFAAATSFGYYVFAYFAYRFAPDAGVVVILLTAQVVVSVILGIVFLHERDNIPRKLAAGGLAFLAGLLIKI